MSGFFRKIDNQFNGWPKTILVIVLEIIIVYLFSNIPFILTALETPVIANDNKGFIGIFIDVLKNEINHGQLLTFVCTLIAPVVFWSFIEYRKALMTKLLSFSALILLALSAYLHDKQNDFEYFTSFNLYEAALFIWAISILSRMIPPEKKDYIGMVDDEMNDFVKSTRVG